jgi:formylglycine-generating enzyme required for sulfatase activity
MKKLIFTASILALMSGAALNAQVTIGYDKSPESFSVLELISNNARGLRLPQLTTQERNDLEATQGFQDEKTDKAMGLQIFNLDTECVETWNGVTWIQTCYNNTPTIPSVPLGTAATCGVTASNSDKTFTAKADPAAVKYEFFVGITSQGKQTTNTITFATAQTPANVSVAYYYPPSYLKPTMLPIPGNSSTAWHYGGSISTTTALIPDFKMSETPVTQAQFESVMGGNPCYFSCNGNGKSYVSSRPTSALPAENMNWYAAITYCNKLSLIEHKTPCYSISGVDSLNLSGGGADGHGWRNIKYDDAVFTSSTTYTAWDAATCNFAADGYRLPTEWEWEYAARGGTSNAHPVFSGSYATAEVNDSLCLVGWFTSNNNTSTTCTNTAVSNIYGTKDVKTKRGNVFGLYDMSGNLYEWCWNWYNATEGGSSGTPFATPTGTVASSGGSNRVMRGGCWYDPTTFCCVSSRVSYINPDSRSSSFGFRVVSL